MQKEILKKKIKENYGKIVLNSNFESCCVPKEWCSSDTNNVVEGQVSSSIIGYKETELKSIPEESIIGLGCGTPLNFAELRKGETVVDSGSDAGINVFLACSLVENEGKVIGIDITDEILKKARRISIVSDYRNVEFRKGDIEKRIPVDNNSVDVVISNCTINLTLNKTNAFKEIYCILKKDKKARMIISNLITAKEINKNYVNANSWYSCIDDALIRENYIKSIRDADFQNIEILYGKIYMDESHFNNGRKIFSRIIKAINHLGDYEYGSF